jgi:hypothetical protein
MRNKRAQVFGLYLVLLTLVMCGMVILLYMKQQQNIEVALVSPVLVLDLRDNLELFEMFEEQAVISSYIETKKSKIFGTDEFVNYFREIFLKKIKDNTEIKDFLSKNLLISGDVEVNLDNVEDYELFLENYLYRLRSTSDYFNEEEFIFTREKVKKKFELNNKDATKINFPVYFSFEFDKTYVLDKEGEVKE